MISPRKDKDLGWTSYLKISVIKNDTKERVKMNGSGGGSLLFFDDLIYYNRELILNYEVEFFHLKK